jgi:hypothetical protein
MDLRLEVIVVKAILKLPSSTPSMYQFEQSAVYIKFLSMQTDSGTQTFFSQTLKRCRGWFKNTFTCTEIFK